MRYMSGKTVGPSYAELPAHLLPKMFTDAFDSQKFEDQVRRPFLRSNEGRARRRYQGVAVPDVSEKNCLGERLRFLRRPAEKSLHRFAAETYG